MWIRTMGRAMSAGVARMARWMWSGRRVDHGTMSPQWIAAQRASRGQQH